MEITLLSCKEITVGSTTYSIPKLGNNGYSVGIRVWNNPFDKGHFVIKTANSDYDKSFFLYPHTPLYIDDVDGRKKFSEPRNIRVLDMPIKFPGAQECRVPNELSQFDETIHKILSFEAGINPNLSLYYFAYLTIDQGYLNSGEYQRRPGCHVNGLQGFRHSPKRPSARSYIVVDKSPPVFYAQEFHVQNLTWHDNFYTAFDKFANERDEIFFDPYAITASTGYTVLKETPTTTNCHRTYFRLTFDTFIYDRLGNSHNPMFNYSWPMVNREIPTYLNDRKWHQDAY